MELRSRRSLTRSRSKTPFTQIYSSGELTVEGGADIEETVTKTTRRTTVYKTNDNAITSSEEYMNLRDSKPVTRSKTANSVSRSFGYKTSDYSSEEGENEVSSSRIISQNDRNQLIEDAKRAANGGHEISALDLYRKAGRYWDKYPKTDWTYSPHSRDRVELAPGVVQMPNMSRRTIHSFCSGDYSTKETNTDETDYASYRRSHDGYYTSMAPQKLFSNNNYKESPYMSRSRSEYVQRSYMSRFTSTLVSIFTTMFASMWSAAGYVVSVPHSALFWVAKQVYKGVIWVMLMDTWLLMKRNANRDKFKTVLLLCLIPLLLIGGFHLYLLSGVSLVPACHPHCGRIISRVVSEYVDPVINATTDSYKIVVNTFNYYNT